MPAENEFGTYLEPNLAGVGFFAFNRGPVTQLGARFMAWKRWVALFRQTALPITGKNLTDAWMLRAVALAHESPVTATVRRFNGRKAATLHRRNPHDGIVFVG